MLKYIRDFGSNWAYLALTVTRYTIYQCKHRHGEAAIGGFVWLPRDGAKRGNQVMEVLVGYWPGGH